jgi:Tfp pilus assembly protein PilP
MTLAAAMLWTTTLVAQSPAAKPAQAPAPNTTPARPPAAAPAASPAPPPIETFTYQPEGRRDPFVSLLGAGVTRVASRRGEGPSGLSVGEMSVRGVLETRGRMVAMIEGPDKMTYIVHPGDKLLDGTIKSINPQGLIVSQDVNDPLSVVKQRDVMKVLRSLEGAKQ